MDYNNFSSFLENWHHRQSSLMHELSIAEQSSTNHQETELGNLVTRVLSHYQEYFEEKSRMAHRDVFIMFSPPWFTPLEKNTLWIAGFKPGMAFSVLETSVNDLSRTQIQRLDGLRNEVRFQERRLQDQHARIQESVAAPPLAVQFREAPGRNGRRVGDVLEPLRVAMENLVIEADSLRITTAESVVEILDPVQKVRYLVGAAQFQIGLRAMGLQRQQGSQNGSHSSNGW